MNNEIRIIRTLYRSLLRTSSKWQSEISRSNSILSVENEIRPFRTYFMEIPKYEENLPDLLMNPEPITSVVRDVFKFNKKFPRSGYLIDTGFNALRDMNKRINTLASFSYNSSSKFITQGVQVEVRSGTSFGLSTQRHYHFPYVVTITNTGPHKVQLKARHWIITDLDGITNEVEGPGVIGQQPTLGPGDSYSYQSYAELRTPFGTMKGSYRMLNLEDLSTFEANIAPFGLIPTSVNML